MKTKTLIILLLISNSIFSQSFYLNNVTARPESPSSIIEYKPNNYIVSGSSWKNYYSGLLMKINYRGEVIKSNILDLDKDFNLGCVFKVSEDTLFVGGATYDELYFSKRDTNLNILWEKTYEYFQIPNHLYTFSWPILDRDSNIVFSGYHNFGPDPFYDKEVFIYKFNLQGDSLDYHRYDTVPTYNFTSFGTNIFQNSATKKYYVNLNNNSDKSMCFEINADLSLDTVCYYESGNNIRPFMDNVSSKFNSDTTFISSLSYGLIHSDPEHAVILLDTRFSVLKWINLSFPDFTIHTHNTFNTIDFIDKNNIFVVSNVGVLSNLDSNLDVRWQKYYAPLDTNIIQRIIFGVKATTDGGAIIILMERTSDNSNISVIKTDSLGNIPLNIQEEYGVKAHDFVVYPNPASDYLKVFKAVQVKQAEFILYNTAGKVVLQNTLFDNITEMNVSNLPQGVYVYNVFENGVLADEGKVVVE